MVDNFGQGDEDSKPTDNFASYIKLSRENKQTRKSRKNQKGEIHIPKNSTERTIAKTKGAQVVTDKELLIARFGKKPKECCSEILEVFSALEKVVDIATFEELDALETIIKHRKKEISQKQAKIKTKTRRNFYQVEVKAGIFVWYVRERKDGKLLQLKYFGNSLPSDIDLELDKVNLHPGYIAVEHSDWISPLFKTKKT